MSIQTTVGLSDSEVDQILFHPAINEFTLEIVCGYIRITRNGRCTVISMHMSHKKVHKNFPQSVQNYI